ncbi:MAG: hypothetical protein Q9195_006716 [Heterodermia aff. obscurata]
MLPSPKPWPMLVGLLLIPQTTLAVTAEPTLPEFPTPIPPSSLPTAYPNSLTAQNPTLDLQIRNTLSHYPLAIDGKNFSALSLVFTQDVVANYSAPLGVLTGLASLMSTLETSLAPVRTQHALSTEVIEILEGESTARSLTYVTATHFGMGAYYGQAVYAYAQYQDDWVRSCCPHEWRIKTRNQVYMGPLIGNLSVFT